MRLEQCDIELSSEDEATVRALIEERDTAGPEMKKVLELTAKGLSSIKQLRKKILTNSSHEENRDV